MSLDRLVRGTAILTVASLVSFSPQVAYSRTHADESKSWNKDPASEKVETRTETKEASISCTPSVSGNVVNVSCVQNTSVQTFERRTWQECEYETKMYTRQDSSCIGKGTVIGFVSGLVLGVAVSNTEGGGMVGGLIGAGLGALGGLASSYTPSTYNDPTGKCKPQTTPWVEQGRSTDHAASLFEGEFTSQPSSVTTKHLTGETITFASSDVEMVVSVSHTHPSRPLQNDSPLQYSQRVATSTDSTGEASVTFQSSRWYLSQSAEDLSDDVIKAHMDALYAAASTYDATINIAVRNQSLQVQVPFKDVRGPISTYVHRFFSDKLIPVEVHVIDEATHDEIACKEISLSAVRDPPTPERLLARYFKGDALQYALQAAPSYSGDVVLASNASTVSVYSSLLYHVTTICPSYYAFDSRVRRGPIRISADNDYLEVRVPIAPKRVEHINIASPQSSVVVRSR